MRWILLDVGIALLAITFLLLVLLRLWRSVKAFSRTVGDAGSAVTAASDKLAAAQGAAPQRR